jgi:hypothetical protein
VGYPVADSRNLAGFVANILPTSSQCFEDQVYGSPMIDKSRILSALIPARHFQADGRAAKSDPLDHSCRKQ